MFERPGFGEEYYSDIFVIGHFPFSFRMTPKSYLSVLKQMTNDH